MTLFTSLVTISLGAILVNNFILAQFLGICPFMGVSQKTSTALGMGLAVTFVMGIASAVTWVVNEYILIPWDMQYMQTVAFILIIAALVQFVEMFLQKVVPALYQALCQNHAVCAGVGRGNGTDRAVRGFLGKDAAAGANIRFRVPFDSSRRYSSGCISTESGPRTLIRGAPEVILPHVTRYIGQDGRIRPITPAVRNAIQKQWQEYAATTHRVIATAEFEGQNPTEAGDFSDLIFVALFAIRDRLRPDAADAVAAAITHANTGYSKEQFRMK